MLPDGVLSTEPVIGDYIGGRALPIADTVDYESGGIALNDPTQGLMYQIWRARITSGGTQIVIDANNHSGTTLYTGTEITELSFTFDQNMRPAVAFVDNGQPKFQWYDSEEESQVVSDLAGDVVTPRVSLDDKRVRQSSSNDIILAYIRNNSLYYRQQRDRFLTEYNLSGPLYSRLIKIGMNNRNRLQFMLEPLI